MEREELIKIIETLLFITDEPLSVSRIAKICEINDEKYIEELIEDIKHSYDIQNRALAITKVAGGWQMTTRAEYSIWVRKLYNTRLTMRLSNAALEVLGIIAYKQPVTKAEIEAIRGVDSSGPIDTLLERKLITSIGRKEVLGRPIMYGTTDEFLKHFGLNSIDDLPKLETIVDERLIENVQERLKEVQKVSECNSTENNSNLYSDLNQEKTESENILLTQEEKEK